MGVLGRLGTPAEKGKDGEPIRREAKAYEVLETYKGSELERKEVQELYACAKEVADRQHRSGIFVTQHTYATMPDGTNRVHIAPAFGDDANVGSNDDPPFSSL